MVKRVALSFFVSLFALGPILNIVPFFGVGRVSFVDVVGAQQDACEFAKMQLQNNINRVSRETNQLIGEIKALEDEKSTLAQISVSSAAQQDRNARRSVEIQREITRKKTELERSQEQLAIQLQEDAGMISARNRISIACQEDDGSEQIESAQRDIDTRAAEQTGRSVTDRSMLEDYQSLGELDQCDKIIEDASIFLKPFLKPICGLLSLLVDGLANLINGFLEDYIKPLFDDSATMGGSSGSGDSNPVIDDLDGLEPEGPSGLPPIVDTPEIDESGVFT